jgi:hypothetical protein
MGGFKLVRADDDVLLDDKSFCDVVLENYDTPVNSGHGEKPGITIPVLTTAEILDKGRGDFLSKAIAILQSIWFIVHCIARGVEGLALTELELITLALASLNGLMYYFWWDKPLGVMEPIRVYTVDLGPPRMVVDSDKYRRVSMINEILNES